MAAIAHGRNVPSQLNLPPCQYSTKNNGAHCASPPRNPLVSTFVLETVFLPKCIFFSRQKNLNREFLEFFLFPAKKFRVTILNLSFFFSTKKLTFVQNLKRNSNKNLFSLRSRFVQVACVSVSWMEFSYHLKDPHSVLGSTT